MSTLSSDRKRQSVPTTYGGTEINEKLEKWMFVSTEMRRVFGNEVNAQMMSYIGGLANYKLRQGLMDENDNVWVDVSARTLAKQLFMNKDRASRVLRKLIADGHLIGRKSSETSVPQQVRLRHQKDMLNWLDRGRACVYTQARTDIKSNAAITALIDHSQRLIEY